MNRNPKEFSFENMDITQSDEEPVASVEVDTLLEDLDQSDLQWSIDAF
jgi:hypothetical protein